MAQELRIRVKLYMADHNATLLSSTSLEQLSRLEDHLSDHPEGVTLISDDDWLITVKSPKAGTIIRFMAFSGAVSSCVNAADTLGRYLRKAYGINGLNERGASLKAVRNRLRVQSALHSVLSDSPGLEWMEKVRDLRGECEHGMLAGSHYQYMGTSSEPLVLRTYCEDNNDIPMSAYLDWVTAKTAELVTKSANVIATDPENAVQLRT